MANDFFQFKRFKVHQGQCAMKVGTDGVLLGAWAGQEPIQSTRILDIGAGSGVISLMLAQQYPMSQIIAVEIDPAAAQQAQENAAASPYANQIEIINQDILTFNEQDQGDFDLIVSNPPFFQQDLPNPDPKKSEARHAQSLHIAALLAISKKQLSPSGRICLILPIQLTDKLIEHAEQLQLFPSQVCKVFPTPKKAAHRILIEFQCIKMKTTHSKITIETDKRHVYSTEFHKLMQPFYLKL